MTRNNREIEEMLDKATDGIRTQQVEGAEVKQAGDRVWARVSAERAVAADATATESEHIHGCDDFQSLIPAYLRGNLTAARALLLEDHTHECVPCRRAVKLAREGKRVAARRTNVIQPSAKLAAKSGWWSSRPTVRWAIAAVVVMGFALIVWQLLPFGSTGATVYAANGPLYRVSDSDVKPIQVGETIGRGETIRTGSEASAVVRLSDGSLVEMKERSELSVNKGFRSTTLNLGRGNVIVDAAPQSGNLYVATNDSLTAVKGTIFSVNNGTKGTRVSVIRGEVNLSHGGKNRTLEPGEQATTRPTLEAIPIDQEVAWSRD
ncbi:MAG: FecR domain-containing protein, partial [Pyrinomonadaceae bacterium]